MELRCRCLTGKFPVIAARPHPSRPLPVRTALRTISKLMHPSFWIKINDSQRSSRISDPNHFKGWNPSMSSDINRLLKTLELGNSAPGISRNLNKFANMKFRRSFNCKSPKIKGLNEKVNFSKT